MEILIEPNRAEKEYLKDLWQFRELLLFLAWRDLKIRYKQTIIGFTWAILRPFLTMVIFTVVFGYIAKLPSEGVAPYSILVFSALLPWQLFAGALTSCSESVLANANLISKVYFPRIIVPISSVLVGFVDFSISFFLLMFLMVYYQHLPSIAFFFLPFFIVVAFISALGMGLWLAALNVRYRDFRHIVPFLIQCGMYISPVGFSSSMVPDQWRFLYSLNPMVGVIDGFRWALIGENSLFLPGVFFSLLSSIILFTIGFQYFRNTERQFADII